MRETGLKEVEEGGVVEFISVPLGVLSNSRDAASIPVASPPRIYADLLRSGGRAEDVAQHLRDEVISPLHRTYTVRSASNALREWEASSRHRVITRSRETGRQDLYASGTWTASYQLSSSSAPLPTTRLLGLLRDNVGHETGWPVWNARIGRPQPADGAIENWLTDGTLFGGSHADYWRARPDGALFLLRGYQEDDEFEGIEPGTALDLTLPVWRVGECLLHAVRMAEALDASRVEFQMRWDGLRGRKLSSLANRGRFMTPAGPAEEPIVTTAIEVRAHAIRDQLADVVRELVEPLFAVFDFFEPPSAIYHEEIAKLRQPVS
jgi:Transcriptional regulator, AbiEi antitoxin, Type IV TA system